MTIDIDMDELLAGGDLPASGAEDGAGDDKPAKGQGADAPLDADGSSDDRERTGADRKRLRSLQRTNSRLSRETEMLRQELSEVRQYVEGLARLEGQRASGSVAAAVEAAERELQQAIDDGDSKAVVEALRKRDEARDRLNRIQPQAGSDAEPSPRTRTRTAADPRQDPAVAAWLERNDWFDWNLGDEDSQAAAAISNDLRGRGIPITDPRHLAEVERQMRAQRPELFDGDGGEPDLPRTAGSTRAAAPGAGNGRKLPPITPAERRAAEMAGLDLTDANVMKRWQAARAERFAKTGRA